jgi:hypothetical protein
MFTYKKAIHKINYAEVHNNVSKKDADMIAKNMIEDYSNSRPNVDETYEDPVPQAPMSPPVQTPPVMMNAGASPSISDDLNGYDYDDNYMSYEEKFSQKNLESFRNKKHHKKEKFANAPEAYDMDNSFAPLN